MCGIFGGVGKSDELATDVVSLAKRARRRGSDASGLIFHHNERYEIHRADNDVTALLRRVKVPNSAFIAGHSRLITNGHFDNQPVTRAGIIAIHNGIVVNTEQIWKGLGEEPKLEIDSEVIPAIARFELLAGTPIEEIPKVIFRRCEGTINCALIIPELGKLLLFTNNGSLYTGSKGGNLYFSSEAFPLRLIGCEEVSQVKDSLVVSVPHTSEDIRIRETSRPRKNLVPRLSSSHSEEALLSFPEFELQRCSKCILPVTMPFIRFDDSGVCNYCANYVSRLQVRPIEELVSSITQHRKTGLPDVIMPFSGGRDSSFGLHVAVQYLGLKPVAYTYDWGMVTDLGRRNISRMCAALGVEHIVIAADIEKKRHHIRLNLEAWLKSPNLGMISILTAGDKHAFKYIETIKGQLGTDQNLWSVNPLEVTHFKSGFLGIPPNFAETKVYASGLVQQIEYQKKRVRAMMASPGYFNSSLWDTFSGEFYRSRNKKSGYHHLFDYMYWDESEIDSTLERYNWERAEDTPTTWRIGDGTAAFYNYIYSRVAGFTEHDTFRSNQIREGALSRADALKLVSLENQPRYPNIRWYLDALGMDFRATIERINSIPRLGN